MALWLWSGKIRLGSRRQGRSEAYKFWIHVSFLIRFTHLREHSFWKWRGPQLEYRQKCIQKILWGHWANRILVHLIWQPSKNFISPAISTTLVSGVALGMDRSRLWQQRCVWVWCDWCLAHDGNTDTVNITQFVNLKTKSNLQNEYKIFSLSIIGKYVWLNLKFLWLIQRNTSEYKENLKFWYIIQRFFWHIFQLWTTKRSYIHFVNYLEFLNLQTE